MTESWALNDEERLKAVPVLHGQGNKLFKQGRFEDATMKYKEAIVCIKNVQSNVRSRILHLIVEKQIKEYIKGLIEKT